MESPSQIIGKICEAKVKAKLMVDGNLVLNLSKGADLIAIDPNGKITIVEVKNKHKKYTPNEDRVIKLAESIGVEHQTIVCEPFQ